jgi:pilus assembly protein TadC
MNTLTTIFVISLVAGVVTFLLAVRVFRIPLTRSKVSKAIADTKEVRKTVVLESDRLAGLARTIAEAGLNLTPARFVMLTIGLALGGTLLAWGFFLPGLPAVAIGVILAYAPYATIKDRIASRGQRIDEMLAISTSRIAVGLGAVSDLPAVLEEVAEDLPAAHPLTLELLRTAADIRQTSAAQALKSLASRSASISLANLAMLLESASRAGGGQYAEAVSDAAMQMQRIIEVRNQARSESTDAMQVATYLPLILGGLLVSMSGDPVIGQALGTLGIQFALLIAMLVMGAGFLIMRSQIRRIV